MKLEIKTTKRHLKKPVVWGQGGSTGDPRGGLRVGDDKIVPTSPCPRNIGSLDCGILPPTKIHPEGAVHSLNQHFSV